MRSRRLGRIVRVASVAALTGVLAAGCGVPWSSGVISDRSADTNGSVAPGNHDFPPGPDGNAEPADFVDAYLAALGGRPDTKSQEAAAVAFMSQATAGPWDPTSQITVVAPVPDTARNSPNGSGGWEYSSDYTVLGLFSPSDGTISPPPVGSKQIIRMTFRMAPVVNDQGATIRRLQFVGPHGVPQGSFLSASALQKYYKSQSVYYWDVNKQVLIPEIRYVALTGSVLQQETTVVNWVLAGPSDALGAAAKAVINTTLLDPLVSEVNGRIVVDLAPAHGFEPDDAVKLADQLRWSLLGVDQRPDVLPTVELQVDRQDKGTTDQTVAADPSNPVSQNDNPAKFAIGNGVVRALDNSTQNPLFLKSAVNTKVTSAAISQDQQSAALVRHLNGKDELWVRFDATGFKKAATATSMSRPNMIAPPQTAVAFVADGDLYIVDRAAPTRPKRIGTPGLQLKSLSVAPDDRRFAFVSIDNKLYTSILIRQAGGPPAMTPPRPVRTELPEVAHADWSGQNQLVVGGSGKNASLYEINSDGIVLGAPIATSGSGVTHVSAFPYDPVLGRTRFSVMYETPSGSHDVENPNLGSDSGPPALTWAAPTDGNWGTPRWPFFAD